MRTRKTSPQRNFTRYQKGSMRCLAPMSDTASKRRLRMRAGLMRDIVVFERPVLNETAYSSSEHTYEEAFRTHARVVHSSGNRSIEADRIVNPFTVKIMIRMYHKVEHGMIARIGNDRYQILDINPQRSQNCITITAEVIHE